MAWWRDPTSESICLFVAYILPCQLVSSSCMRVSLSGSKCVSILLESTVIPKKGREIAGPSTFSNAKGTLRSSHVLVMMFKFCLQISEVGDPTVKKSSKSVAMKEGCTLLQNDPRQQISKNVLSSCGADLSPNNKQVSIYNLCFQCTYRQHMTISRMDGK